MEKKKKLNETQQALYNEICKHITTEKYMLYDDLKKACNFKSFDVTFNAIYWRNWVKRYYRNDKNEYLLT